MEKGCFMMEQGSNITEEGVEVSTLEIERLIRWLVEHGHTYEEAYECIAFISGKDFPNAKTRAAFEEGDKLLTDPDAKQFHSVEELFEDLDN